MNTIKLFLLSLSLTVCLFSNGQHSTNGIVVSTLPLGNNHFSIINELETGIYFKTSPYSGNVLTTNQQVELYFKNSNNLNRAEIIDPLINQIIICHKINNPNLDIPLDPNFRPPTLVDEILFFDDQEHVQEVYQMLDAYMQIGDYDERLDEIELNFTGYKSFRKWFNEEHNWLDGEFTLDELETISECDYLNDEIHKTIINEYAEIGIGNRVYYFHNEKTSLSYDVKNDAAKKHLREVGKNVDVIDISLLEYLGITIEYGGPTVNKGSVVIDETLKYNTYVSLHDIECDVFTKNINIYIEECITNPGNSEQCGTYFAQGPNTLPELEIDWGDGTIETIANYQNDATITHIYTQSNVYFIQTKYTFEDINGDEQEVVDGDGVSELEVTVGDACVFSGRSDFQIVQQGQWAMFCKIWSNHVLGTNYGSYTHLWKVNGNNYSRRKGNIYTKTAGTFRQGPSCDYINAKSGDKVKNNSKKVQKIKSNVLNFYRFADGEVWSQHWYNKNGQIQHLVQFLIAC